MTSGFSLSTSCDSICTQIKGAYNLNRLTQNTHLHSHTTQICCLGIKIIFLDCYIDRLKSNDTQKDSQQTGSESDNRNQAGSGNILSLSNTT